MKNLGLFLMIIGVFFLLPACSDDDNDITDGYTIVAEPNNPEYGSVTGAGVYEDGETVILTAAPAEGYFFMFWSEDDEMVHDDQIYEFIASDDRTLVAHFSDEDDLDAGFFTAEITGDVEWSFDGYALFGETTSPDTSQELFIVVLADKQGDATISFVKGGNRPATGELAIGDIGFEDIQEEIVFPEDYFLAVLLNFSGAEFYLFGSDHGNIDITESTADSFVGSFSYDATGILATQPINELEITVEGSFSAIFGDVDVPGL